MEPDTDQIANAQFHALTGLLMESLGENEYWCIAAEDGAIEETATKEFALTVSVMCDALQMDWDQVKACGLRLTKVVLAEPSKLELKRRDYLKQKVG